MVDLTELPKLIEAAEAIDRGERPARLADPVLDRVVRRMALSADIEELREAHPHPHVLLNQVHMEPVR